MMSAGALWVKRSNDSVPVGNGNLAAVVWTQANASPNSAAQIPM
jgi:hypothetical protein